MNSLGTVSDVEILFNPLPDTGYSTKAHFKVVSASDGRELWSCVIGLTGSLYGVLSNQMHQMQAGALIPLEVEPIPLAGDLLPEPGTLWPADAMLKALGFCKIKEAVERSKSFTQFMFTGDLAERDDCVAALRRMMYR